METIYKVVIIDDDEAAIDSLQLALRRHPQFSVEATARNGSQGKSRILSAKPDLLFLDVELPDMSGIELLNRVHPKINWEMRVIFYTAYDQYMLDAIRSSIFDFLLKPIESVELSDMLRRFSSKREEERRRTQPTTLRGGASPVEHPLIIPSPTNDLRFIRPENIGYFRYNPERRAWEAYLCDSPTPIPLRKSISAEQIQESSPSFAQIHQSCIININYLMMIKERYCVLYPPFEQARDLLVSKLYLKRLQERFPML